MKKKRLQELVRATALVAVLAGAVLMNVDAAQPAGVYGAKDFAGTWHWMFQGKPFATIVLEQNGDQFTGSITHGSIDIGSDGKITSAVAAEGSSPVIRTAFQNGVLRIVEKDGDDETEWAMTLNSATTAELRIAGADAPPAAEPVRLEKAQ